MAPNAAGRPSGFQSRKTGSTPVGQYATTTQLESIPGGQTAGTVAADGTCTLLVGPSGLGTVWYPAFAAGGTTTGPITDTSSVSLYVSPLTDTTSLIPLTQIGGVSGSGGGWSVPLQGSALYPGYFVIAQWSGGNAGDQATLTVYGSQKALTA